MRLPKASWANPAGILTWSPGFALTSKRPPGPATTVTGCPSTMKVTLLEAAERGRWVRLAVASGGGAQLEVGVRAMKPFLTC